MLESRHADDFRSDLPHRRARPLERGERADPGRQQGGARRAQRRRQVDTARFDPRRAAARCRRHPDAARASPRLSRAGSAERRAQPARHGARRRYRTRGAAGRTRSWRRAAAHRRDRGAARRDWRARREAAARQAALAQRQQRERERLQRFIDRFRYKASKARQAQSRVKALARLEPVALIADTAPVTLRLPQPAGLSPPLISLDRVSTGYVPDKPILSRLDLRLDPDDRIALLGANGNGKTTFARLLAGRLEPFSGQMIRAPKLACGFFAQHQIEEMRPTESAFEHLAALMPESPPETVRARLGGFGFSQDKAFVPVGELSGGERARLNLALVTYNAPGLLILDEPTNHLDMETREALVAALAEYSGAVILVSHDWHLVELVADRLWLVEDGTVRPFDDDLGGYRRRLLAREEPPARKADGATAVGDPRRADRRSAAERRQALQPLRRTAREAEAAAARLAAEQLALDRKLAAPGAFDGRDAALADAL